jgi:uncharacterized phage protein (predicted DNA packaging)
VAAVSLIEAKAHLRVDQDDEDTIIELYMDAATDYIQNFLNEDLSSDPASAIKAAALLIIGDLYENREGAGQNEIKPNPAVMNLLYPYRKNLGI